MAATVKIVTVPDKTTDGRLPIKLRVTYNRKVRYFPLSRYSLPENWDKASGRYLRGHPDWKLENEVLLSYDQKAAAALRGFELDGVQFTFEKFEAKVFGLTENVRQTAGQFILSLAADIAASGNLGNSEVYKHCGNSVEAYKPKATLSDIDQGWLHSFEKFLIKRGTGGGGMSVIMRTLRAACNRAVKSGAMPKTWQPFSDFSISHLKGAKAKKALPLAIIKKIEGAAVPEHLELSRDLFLLSFYLRGMNLADMAELTSKNVKNDRVVYTRKKTKRQYSVAINEKAAAILLEFSKYSDGYLVPIFSARNHITPRQKMYRVKRVTKTVNAEIREVAKLLGIDTENFTFYTARHSYATALERQGVSRVIISQALGHTSLATTEGYLKEFGDKDLDEADRLLD